jgi:hypothetical protein
LPPISVSASVDKMFAVRYRPYKTGFSGGWLKNDQINGFARLITRKARYIAVFRGFPQIGGSCPQSLLALLWIRCSPSAASHV